MALWLATRFLFILLTAKLILSIHLEYTIKHEAVRITDYNREYFEDPKIVMFWYNRTTKAFNSSTYLKQDLGVNLQINVTVYKFINYQFRYYPVEFKKNFCEFLRMNLFGFQDIARMVNVTECPILQGYYNLTNVIPDITKFPRYLIPNGRYKISGSMYSFSTYLGTGLWQGEIQPVDLKYLSL